MNEIKSFENKGLKIKVRAIQNEDGSISINAEDTAIGFGWTKTENKDGKEYTSVRWERMNGFSREIGFDHKWAKDDYIPEPLFYRLGMKASNDTAEKFQNWLAFDVIPSIRKTGTYETPKAKQRNETLASVNNAVKIITPFLVNAGCSENIQLLTVKTIYEKAGIEIPIDIKADQKFYSTEYIARELKMKTSSGNPAIGAVNEIIRQIGYSDSEVEVVYFDNHGHQGTTNQYSQSVIDRVAEWLSENNNPLNISYTDKSGHEKAYHVVYA